MWQLSERKIGAWKKYTESRPKTARREAIYMRAAITSLRNLSVFNGGDYYFTLSL